MSSQEVKNSFHDIHGFHKGTCWAVTLTVNLGMVFSGYGSGVLNTIQSYIVTNVFQWSGAEATFNEGLMNSVLCGGGAVGTLFGGILAKKFGRKNTMIFADVIGMNAAICATIPVFPIFLIGRFLFGFASGVNCTVVPLYVSEVNPLPLRGPTGSSIQSACSIGTLLGLLLGFGMPQDGSVTSWWRFMLGLPLIFCVLRIVLLSIYNIEPARYLMTKGRDAEAEKSLSRIYHKNYVLEQMTAIRDEIAQASASATREMQFSDLFTPRWRYRFFLGLFVAASCQLTFVTGISLYSTNLYKEITQSQLKAQVLTCIMMSCTLIANFGAGTVTSRVGRKPLLLFGALGMTLVWFFQTIFVKYHLTTGAEVNFFVFFILFGLSYGPVLWIYVAEVLPDIAIGMGLFLDYMVQVIVAQIFPVILKELPVCGSLIPGAITLGIFFVVLFFLKETKDKTPQEISALFYKAAEAAESADESAQLLIPNQKKFPLDASKDNEVPLFDMKVREEMDPEIININLNGIQNNEECS